MAEARRLAPDVVSSWAATFKILGDPTRLDLLNAIHAAGEDRRTVTDLASETGTRVATASAALRAMEKVGSVRSLRDGRTILYDIADEHIHELLHWMDSRSAEAGGEPAGA